jgi:hypothetical protein
MENAIERALVKADLILPLAAAALENSVYDPEMLALNDRERLANLITLAEGTITILAVYLKSWARALGEQ